MQPVLDLLNETKKQLEHLRVLGIEGIRPTAAAPAPITRAETSKQVETTSRVFIIRRPDSRGARVSPVDRNIRTDSR